MNEAEEIVCYCGGVPRSRIVEAIRAGAKTLKDVQEITGAGVGSWCKELNPKGRCCHEDIVAILKQVLGSKEDSGCCCRSQQSQPPR